MAPSSCALLRAAASFGADLRSEERLRVQKRAPHVQSDDHLLGGVVKQTEEVLDFSIDQERTGAARVLEVPDQQRPVREREIHIRFQPEVLGFVEQIALADADLSLEARLVELQRVKGHLKFQVHPGLTAREQNEPLVDQLVELGQAELGLERSAHDRLQEVQEGRAGYLKGDASIGSRESGQDHCRVGIAVRLVFGDVVRELPVERDVGHHAVRNAELAVLDVGVDHDRGVALVVDVAVDDTSRLDGLREIELIEDPPNVVGHETRRVEPSDFRPDVEVEERRLLADREAALDRKRVLPDRQGVRFDRQAARRFRKRGFQNSGHLLISDETPVDAEKGHAPGEHLQLQPGSQAVRLVIDRRMERVDDEVKQLLLGQVLDLEVDVTQLDVTDQDRGGAAARSPRRAGRRGLEDVEIGDSVRVGKQVDGRAVDQDRLHVDLATEQPHDVQADADLLRQQQPARRRRDCPSARRRSGSAKESENPSGAGGRCRRCASCP